MRIAILGFGREGKAILKLLKKKPPKQRIVILDQTKDKNYLKRLKEFDIVYRSPGIPYNTPEIQSAIKQGVIFSSATKIFFNSAKGIVIGITGTKGKGTTSLLLYQILKTSGKDAYLAGNIGVPAIEILPKLKNKSITVLELSSFQLQDLEQSPQIAVITHIFPDHMDHHKNFKEYLNAKTNITKWQSAGARSGGTGKKSDKVYYFSKDKYSRWIAQKGKGKKIGINPTKENIEHISHSSKLPGKHMHENILMAVTVAKSLGCSEKIIEKVVKKYRGLPHRLEFVRSIKNRGGTIKFYNDSASTSPQTSAAAIKSFDDKTILIAGGQDKYLDYKPLSQALRKSKNVECVVLFGENKNKIKRSIQKSGVKIKTEKKLENAVKSAYSVSKKLSGNSVVVFSPGAASFDMFKNYADRGEQFKKIVKRLK